MEGIYKVNLIPSDLGTEESIIQIADTLENLNGIIDDVFDKLTRRISSNLDKTNRLKERIEISRLKVEKLTGMQKAIKVFSSAKYPASITHEHYQSVFDLDSYRHEPKKAVLSGKIQRQPRDKGLQEKLHFFHVKVAPPKTVTPKPDFNLAAIIDDLPTICELLVFNTDESPYLGTVSKTTAYVPKVAVAENKSLLEAAPSSIVHRDVLKREADEYMYAPGMGIVPELEMPLDLPHLPGVAGDVQFSVTSDGSIAPSVVASPLTPAPEPPQLDLPDLKDLPVPELPKAGEIPLFPPDIAEVPVPDIPDAAPPVPPAMPPPPPPPPPPPADGPAASIGLEQPASAPAGDVHGALMAAIRQAGGAGRAKLRPAADTSAEQGSKPPSGGLMADLHAKLMMRRRGISGAEARAGSLLETLYRVIPEPGDQSSPQRSSSEEDWE